MGISLVLLVIVIAVAVWWLDFDRPLKNAAAMANREILVRNNSHKAKAVSKMASLDLSSDDVSKAKSNISVLDSFEL